MSRSTIKDPAKSKSSETFFKVLRFIGRYRFLLILSIILAAISVILQLYVPILFGNAIDQVIAQHQVNFEMMWYYLSRILAMVILSSAATWLMNVINNRMTYQTVKDIRAKAVRHIQVLPLSYLDGHSTGDIISRIIADTDILSDGMLLWIYPAFFRNRNDHRNTDLHVFQKLLDYIDGHCPDPRKLFGGQIYFFPYLPDVPEAKRCQRTSDCSHRRDDWKPEGCSGFWI